jgi:hypothetical protein
MRRFEINGPKPSAFDVGANRAVSQTFAFFCGFKAIGHNDIYLPQERTSPIVWSMAAFDSTHCVDGGGLCFPIRGS